MNVRNSGLSFPASLFLLSAVCCHALGNSDLSISRKQPTLIRCTHIYSCICSRKIACQNQRSCRQLWLQSHSDRERYQFPTYRGNFRGTCFPQTSTLRTLDLRMMVLMDKNTQQASVRPTFFTITQTNLIVKLEQPTTPPVATVVLHHGQAWSPCDRGHEPAQRDLLRRVLSMRRKWFFNLLLSISIVITAVVVDDSNLLL